MLRTIAHPYPDTLPAPDTARCYAFEEVFAEKLRAMAQRGRPRDLYDIVNLFRRKDLRLPPAPIRETLVAKCKAKGIAVPTAETIASAPHRAELESEWANMLGHQLPALPPLEQFIGELPALFAWLHDETQPPPLPAIPTEPGEDATWTPPTTVTTWEQSVPIEPIRFAGANHLCVEVTYDGSVDRVQPYALRRTQAGQLALHALHSDTGEHRTCPVEQMQRAEVTTEAFRPVYAIELSASRPLTMGDRSAR